MYSKKLDVIEALTLLKSDYILESFNENSHYVFYLEENKIVVKSKDFNAKLNIFDFKEIFKNYQFLPIKDDNDANKIEIKKDEEYYSSLQKRQ